MSVIPDDRGELERMRQRKGGQAFLRLLTLVPEGDRRVRAALAHWGIGWTDRT